LATLALIIPPATATTKHRAELAELQVKLHRYTQALAKMANVEDLTKFETA
jgi:hypothetical protein